MSRYLVYPLSPDGSPANVVRGVAVTGELVGVRGLTFTPQGAKLDGVGSISFSVPTDEPRNAAVGAGMQVGVKDTWINDFVAVGPVAETSRDPAAGDGMLAVKADDLLRELVMFSVTSGFAAAPGESLYTTLTRLVRRRFDRAWVVEQAIGSALDGIAFQATGSILSAIGKLAGERFANFTRGQGRTLRFFRPGGSTNLLLTSEGGDTYAEPPPGVLYVRGLPITASSGVVNSVTPQGSGTGSAALTLGSLYERNGERVIARDAGGAPALWESGPASFRGYDPAHPIRKRPREDGGGFDGYDYLLEDDASIAANGRMEGSLPKNDIGPAKTSIGTVSAVDEREAAIALYQASLANLLQSCAPRLELRVTTGGTGGDLRDVAGKTVWVRYSDTAVAREGQATTTLDIDRALTVRDLSVSVGDDDSETLTWTLSDGGGAVASGEDFVLAQLDQVYATANMTGTYPQTVPYATADNGGPGFPVGLTVFGGNNIVRMHEATVWVTPGPLRVAAKPKEHVHNIPALAVQVQVPSTDVVIPALTATVPGQQITVPGQTITVPGQQITVPGQTMNVNIPSLPISGGYTVGMAKPVPASGSYPVSVNIVNGSLFLYNANYDGRIPLAGFTTATGTGTTTSTAAQTVATVAQTTSTVAQQVATVAQQVATIPQTTATRATVATGATGATLTGPAVNTGAETGMTNQMNGGGTPTGLELWVDSTRVLGPAPTLPPFDILPYVKDRARHRVEVRMATQGHIELQIFIIQDVSTLAVGTTG